MSIKKSAMIAASLLLFVFMTPNTQAQTAKQSATTQRVRPQRRGAAPVSFGQARVANPTTRATTNKKKATRRAKVAN